ncbi:pilus assembly PilX family protein [Undibacterium sp. TJN19]|uniref:pilus assembly PilX family protein n=1 Tax=Undibacterium sp. TJN19 TaxID=3413055 RepID=UPI003BF34021
MHQIKLFKTRDNVSYARANSLANQRGISLAVVLVLVGLLAMIGISAMQMNILQEKGAGNYRDQDVAFQTAESALRDAELYVDTYLTPTSNFAADCTGGLCLPSATSTPVWSDATMDVWNNASRTLPYSQTAGDVSQQPRYIIELTAQNIDNGALDVGGLPGPKQATYRITVKAWGSTPSAQVLLQSVYLK